MAVKVTVTNHKEWEIECQTDGDGRALLVTVIEQHDAENSDFAQASLDKKQLAELIEVLNNFHQQMIEN